MSYILVPIDFSDCSKHALTYAYELANALEKPLMILHTYTREDDLKTEPNRIFKTKTTWLLNHMKEYTQQVLSLYPKFDIDKLHFRVFDGNVVNGVIDTQKKSSIDLVVMGTKGGIKNRQDSFTNEVIIKSLSDVFIVPEKANFEGITNITFASKRINEETCEDLTKLNNYATDLKADITILYINTEVNTWGTKKEDEINTRQVSNASDTVLASPREGYIMLNHKTYNDVNPSEGILRYLDENKTDLVCIRPNYHCFVEKFFNKSITKDLSLYAQTPILVLKDQ